MAENNSKGDNYEKQNPMKNKRQEGDGYANGEAVCFVAPHGPDLTADTTVNQEEKDGEEKDSSVDFETFEQEAENSNINLNKNNNDSVSESCSARATDLESEKKIVTVSVDSQLSASSMKYQKDLRQHSQELIRRILQCSPKLKNFPSSNGKEDETEVSLQPSTPMIFEEEISNLKQEETEQKDLTAKESAHQKSRDIKAAAMQPPTDRNLLESCKSQQRQSAVVKGETLVQVQQDSGQCDVQSDSITSLDSGSTEVIDANKGSHKKEDFSSQIQQTPTASKWKPHKKIKSDGNRQERENLKPSQENLSEILRLLKTQNNNPDVLSFQQNFKEQSRTADCCRQAPPASTIGSREDSFTCVDSRGTQPGKQIAHGIQNWTTLQPWELLKQNTADMQERQVSSLRSYYEAEIKALTDQVEHLRGNISSLHEALPLRMLETANAKLEGRCHLLEDLCNELQAKCQKYERSCQELEVSCRQLSRANQNLEMRCLHLEQANESLSAKQLNLSSNKQELEASLLEMKNVNEKAAVVIQEQQQVHKDAEIKYLQLEDTRNKLEAKYKKYRDQNLTLEQDIKHMQESLVSSTRHSEEMEKLVSSLNSEKNDWKLKLDAAHKVTAVANQRLEELKSHTLKKENEVQQLQDQVRQLTRTLERVNKTNTSMEADSRQDKELLQKLLAEFDALSTDYKASRIASQALEQKLNESQDEISELQGKIQKMAQRNLSLEESLRETIGQINRTSSPVQTRNRWSSTAKLSRSPNTSLKSHNDSGVGSTLDSQATPISPGSTQRPSASLQPNALEEQFATASPMWKTSTPLKKHRSVTSNMTTKSPKKSLDKSFSSAFSPTTNDIKSPGSMVVKQSDLVTRFDIVFEDTESGQEATRTRIGHNRRLYGNSVTDEGSPATHDVSKQQENTVNSVLQRLGISDAERALNAIRAGRVTSFGDWENKGTVNIESGNNKRTAKVFARQGKEREKGAEGYDAEPRRTYAFSKESSEEVFVNEKEGTVMNLERKFSKLTDERKRLESTLSRIPSSRMTKRAKEDKAFLENRLDEVEKGIGSVRMQLRRFNAL